MKYDGLTDTILSSGFRAQALRLTVFLETLPWPLTQCTGEGLQTTASVWKSKQASKRSLSGNG